MTPKPTSINEGIQATTVNADVLAVGRGAKATKVVHASDQVELLNAVRNLERALAGMSLSDSAKQAVQKDCSKMKEAVQKKQPNSRQVGTLLQHLTRRLKTTGVIIKDVAGLIGPIEKIAGIVHLTLASLGV
jgi:hypothetical protein